MQTLHALDRNCTVPYTPTVNPPYGIEQRFTASMLQTGMWLGRGRQEICTEFWEGLVVETVYKRPKLHGYVGNSPGLYQMVAFGSSDAALTSVVTIHVVAT